MDQQKWVIDNGVYKLNINDYQLIITDNSVFIWWCCLFKKEVVDSSYNRGKPKPKTIKEAKEAAYNSHIDHYTKDLDFPDFLN